MEGKAIKCAIINFEGGVDVEYYNKVDVIYQTQGRMFHQISKHEWIQKTRRSRVFFFFNQLRSVCTPSETPFRAFDIASQTLFACTFFFPVQIT